MSENAILDDYEADLGSLSHVPVIVVTSAELTALELDSRAGFVLALVDGTLDIQTIIDVSGMQAADTLAILQDLRDKGIVTFR